jgi:hypothetical protein
MDITYNLQQAGTYYFYYVLKSTVLFLTNHPHKEKGISGNPIASERISKT